MLIRSAEFSRCRIYRYSLTRVWDVDLPMIAFIGLNPSTADEVTDDPTVRRCIGFARTWKCGGLVLVNLFAFRATDLTRLKQVASPIGPGNDDAIARHCQSAHRVVAAWGNQGCHLHRDAQVLVALSAPLCLGITSRGAPKHPLYLASKTRLRAYRGTVVRTTIPLPASPLQFDALDVVARKRTA